MVPVRAKGEKMTPANRKATAELLEKNKAADVAVDNEPTTEELVEMLRESIKQANAGQTRPIEELLRELDEILAEDNVEG